MKIYSLWSALAALSLMSIALWRYFSDPQANTEMLYFMALALFHGIFAIWYWQGRQLSAFMWAGVFARLLTGSVYWTTAWLVYQSGSAVGLPGVVIKGYLVYLLLQGAADLVGSVIVWRTLAGQVPVTASEASSPDQKLNLEIRNRFAFALYMLFLGGWVLLGTGSFLAFFHLPATLFTDWNKADAFIPGPIHLFGMQVMVLACYNLVAVRYRLTNLINAGIRGGLFTCVFVLLLVVFQVLHPITLLLPAVDLISVGIILLQRFGGLIKAA